VFGIPLATFRRKELAVLAFRRALIFLKTVRRGHVVVSEGLE
jgi:hypothetical protein